MHTEGVDQTAEKVYETNHPIERGKVTSFELGIFPGAIGVAIEFDKRCQCDTKNDFMVIQSWYDAHATGLGFN